MIINFIKLFEYHYIYNTLFAYRATDPKNLREANEYNKMVGKDNNSYIEKALQSGDKIVVAWGKHGKIHKRYLDEALKELFSKYQL